MLKKCKDCGNVLGNDKVSGHFWCTKCKEVKEEYDLKYKICILGKNTGKEIGTNNVIKKIGKALSDFGHEVIGVRFGEIYDYTQTWDMTDYFINKKKIPLVFVDRIYSPDFIVVEQTYNRFDVSEINCPIIYLHREYTHFADITEPDILLGSYPHRLEIFEYHYPYEYAHIPYCDTLYVAVDPELFDPNIEKIIKGVTMIGWATNPYNFADANGVIARMVIDDQVGFYQDCIKKGLITYIKGGIFKRYRELLGQCEAVLIDGGYINVFGRRLFEAMASKTLCVVRVHSAQNMETLKNMGLTGEMCYFIYEPDDIKYILEVVWDEDKNNKKIEKAYDWVIAQHTYKVRANELLRIFEEFKNGMRKKEKFMGYAIHNDIKIQEGKIIYREII